MARPLTASDVNETTPEKKVIKEVIPWRWVHLPIYLILIIGAFISMVPFFSMISTSLMTLGETLQRSPLPAVPQWSNYVEAWTEANFSRYFWNSVIITSLTIVGLLTTSVLAAYAFARIEFPGRNVLFMLVLATLMVPGTVTFIPNILMIRGDIVPWGSFLPETIQLFQQGAEGDYLIDFKVFGYNALSSLTVPFFANAFSIFLLRQFFIGIPRDLWDAARIDGAGHVRFLRSVVLPMSKPVLMTVTLLTFIGAWNEFLWPLLVTTTQTWRPLGVGLYTFVNEAGAETHLMMAGAMITIIPVLVIYFFTQKQFTEGIATSGLKG